MVSILLNVIQIVLNIVTIILIIKLKSKHIE